MRFGYDEARSSPDWPRIHWNAENDRCPGVWHVWCGEFDLRFTGSHDEAMMVREVLNRNMGIEDAQS